MNNIKDDSDINPMDPFRYYPHISRLVYLDECKNISSVARAFGEKRKGSFYTLNFFGNHFERVYKVSKRNQLIITAFGRRIASRFKPKMKEMDGLHGELEAIRISNLHEGVHEDFPATAKPFHGIDPYLHIDPCEKSIVMCIKCKIRMMVKHTASVEEWIEHQIRMPNSSFLIIRADQIVI